MGRNVFALDIVVWVERELVARIIIPVVHYFHGVYITVFTALYCCTSSTTHVVLSRFKFSQHESQSHFSVSHVPEISEPCLLGAIHRLGRYLRLANTISRPVSN
ncbi:hypothetical protein CEXT_452171 [Caerostris extrusa]|uniref:Uncharacterized protein n=1 Tax=Caerostris extrusa TaxID=172846 RepID=A0AAV4T2D7_CAEEX|nr:hypothetical protein CEXT_452171 [Caerostris extrusa]